MVTNRYGFAPRQRWQLLFEVVAVKSWHLFSYFILPGLIVGWQVALVFYFIHFMVLSITLLMVFAMAHLSQVQDMPAEKGKYKDWALHQLATTANFSPDNRLLSYVIGGLNYQIEHHIFPKISHTRYPLIRQVVRTFYQSSRHIFFI